MNGVSRLMALLLYDAGLRLIKCCGYASRILIFLRTKLSSVPLQKTIPNIAIDSDTYSAPLDMPTSARHCGR